jgi:hypothetical protein
LILPPPVPRHDDDGAAWHASRHATPRLHHSFYVLELDREKWIKSLSDDQRKMDVELSAGEELEVTVQ